MRLEDWATRLREYIEASRDLPFEWGKRDCMLYAADAVQVQTGKDLAEPFRGYTTEKQARRILQDQGGMVVLVDSLLSRRDGSLQRGDIGLIELDDREFLAVVYLQHAITPGPEHILMNDVSACRFGWAV